MMTMKKQQQRRLAAVEMDGCVTSCYGVLGDSQMPHHVLHHGHSIALIVVSLILPVQSWESYAVLKAQFPNFHLEDKVTLLH